MSTYHANPACAYPVHPGDTCDDGTIVEVHPHTLVVEEPSNMPGQTQPWATVIQRAWIDSDGEPTPLGSAIFSQLANTLP